MKRLLALLLVCLIGASCQQGPSALSPAAPTPPAPALSPRPLYPPDSWKLTATIASVTPHRCWRDLAGRTQDLALAVRRAEAMRLFVYWDPTDGIEYNGTLSGQDFALSGSFNRGVPFGIGCANGASVQVILSGRVSGRFSDDGGSISAEEVLSYQYVGTGEQVDVRFQWVATAPVN